ncbi:MAG TPA: peptide-methionine (R)-S-oxide reductase MsrB [Sphingomicrobium sp.]|nr:peptide-methionine (R)-S-oxide reductase MsrB [Sphingomicrobium sp.]
MSSHRLARRDFVRLCTATAAGLILFGDPGSAARARFPVTHSPSEWRRLLGPQRYHILREAGTELAFTSPLLKEHRKGIFNCAGCGQPLFLSSTKFESGTGWPSFWKVLAGSTIARPDRSLGNERTEILCARCGGHLGHVFNDGPQPTGLRYCMNGLALTFRPS